MVAALTLVGNAAPLLVGLLLGPAGPGPGLGPADPRLPRSPGAMSLHGLLLVAVPASYAVAAALFFVAAQAAATDPGDQESQAKKTVGAGPT